MKLELLRVVLGARATVGVLRVDGKFQCYVLEDTYRPPPEAKVPRFTCIPTGTYRVELTHSPRFGVEMPLLCDVPNFSGVRIHPGNDAGDTEGCLLPGRYASDLHVGESRLAYEALFARLRAAKSGGEDITITISII